MDKQEFIKRIAGCVQKYAPAYGILVHSPIIAQAILESGWGERTAWKPQGIITMRPRQKSTLC